MRQIDLSGKTAIVTGGGQGIGLATATSLYSAGANLVINYFDDPEGSNRSIAEAAIAGWGERAIAVPADVRNSEQLAAMAESAVKEFGGARSTGILDAIVNGSNGLLASIKSISGFGSVPSNPRSENANTPFSTVEVLAQNVDEGRLNVRVVTICGF